MNRIIRSPQLAEPAELFAGDEPRFYDDAARAAIDAEVARAFEAGRREGFAAGRQETISAVQRLEAALAAALGEAGAMRRAAVDDTLQAGLAVAEFVLGTAVVDATGPLADRIAEAAGDIDDDTTTLYVNPSDWDVIAPVLQLPPGFTVERDPSIRPGEARIQGPWASVELTRSAALQRAREALA